MLSERNIDATTLVEPTRLVARWVYGVNRFTARTA
jgi:hypothetical protein